MELTSEHSGSFSFEIISKNNQLIEHLKLLNDGFKVPTECNFFDDFPVWNDCCPTLKIGAYQAGKLISTASIRSAKLKLPSNQTLSIGIIGAVVTDEKWRGLGVASKAISLALLWAKEKNLPLVVLWGSEHALYQKIGFELCGEQIRIPLNLLPKPNKNSPTRNLHHGWHDQIFEFLKTRQGGLALTEQDKRWVLAHKNVRWWWLAGPDESPISYAAVGRGIDLKDMVHEWGGDKNSLLDLLGQLQANGVAKEIIGPKFLFKNYLINSSQGLSEFLCLAKILDAKQIFSAFFPNETPTLPALENPDLVRIFFGPGFDGVYWNQHLPLPLWFWGLDGA